MRQRPTNKHLWMEAMRGVDALSASQFRVLVMLSTYANGQLENARMSKARLFRDACVDPRTGNGALRIGEQLGFIEKVKTGGNGARDTNIWALTIPDPKGGSDSPPSGLRKGGNDYTPSEPSKGGNECAEGGHSLSDKGGNDYTPIRVLSGKNIRGEGPDVVAPTPGLPPQPPKRCPTHENTPGPIPPCGACKDARAEREEWDRRNTTFARDKARCPDCRGTNWITDKDDNPISKCNHVRAPLKETA